MTRAATKTECDACLYGFCEHCDGECSCLHRDYLTASEPPRSFAYWYLLASVAIFVALLTYALTKGTTQ